MQTQTSIPIQYSQIGSRIKKLLHTKIGAFVGYHAGISGFNRIDATIIRSNGRVERLLPTYNSRVNVGAALNASLMSGTSLGSITSPLPPKYIALSTSSLTPSATDTTLSGETSATGLARVLGTIGSYSAPASLDSSASYIVSNTFTAGTTATIVSAALFDAVSSGNMFVEANLSTSAVLSSTDQLIIQWTVNL